MDPSRFAAETFGRATREPGSRWSFWYFHPSLRIRQLDLDATTIKVLSDADASLGRLSGLGTLVRDPELLLGPYLTQEAVASSRIEGTQASLSDVLRAEAGGGPSANEDVAEVERYVAAARRGFELVQTLPITQRLMLELHRTLLSGVRGKDKLPGEYRRTVVRLGSTTDSPETAVFVPPLPAELPGLMTDWEQFVNAPGQLPTLVRCALMHYQFETIHPFLDGNGRIGRLLINLMLMQEGRLERPLLYVSGYFESHRLEYYERLQQVRERGQIQEWLQFFLTAIRRSADDAVHRAEQLVRLREEYLAQASQTRSALPVLVEMLFRNPFVTVNRVERSTGLTNQGARNLVTEAARRGWLEETGARGRAGRTYWVARALLRVIESPAAYG